MRAKEFLKECSVDDFDVFGRHEEHYSLDDLMEEYAKIYHEQEVKKLRLANVSKLINNLKELKKDGILDVFAFENKELISELKTLVGID